MFAHHTPSAPCEPLSAEFRILVPFCLDDPCRNLYIRRRLVRTTSGVSNIAWHTVLIMIWDFAFQDWRYNIDWGHMNTNHFRYEEQSQIPLFTILSVYIDDSFHISPLTTPQAYCRYVRARCQACISHVFVEEVQDQLQIALVVIVRYRSPRPVHFLPRKLSCSRPRQPCR